MKWKMIAIDIDGTLLTDDHQITQENLEAIKVAVGSGIAIVLCSGRSSHSIRHVAKDIPGIENQYIIGFNGGEIQKMNTGEMIHQTLLPRTEALDILDYIESLEAFVPFVYINAEKALAAGPHEALETYTQVTGITFIYGDFKQDVITDVSKVIILGLEADIKRLNPHMKQWLPPHIHCFMSTPTLLEFAPLSVNKGDALKILADTLGISMEEVISIGDSENDLSMIVAAKKGVSMPNGAPVVLAAADYVTKRDNNCSAVAEVIHWAIMKNKE